MPEITRRQAWMKLAVLIADGLPEPKSIGFDNDGPLVELDSAGDLQQWADALGATGRTNDPFIGSKGTKLYSASRGGWYGLDIVLNAFVRPVPEEDLTAVRALAESTPDGA